MSSSSEDEQTVKSSVVTRTVTSKTIKSGGLDFSSDSENEGNSTVTVTKKTVTIKNGDTVTEENTTQSSSNAAKNNISSLISEVTDGVNEDGVTTTETIVSGDGAESGKKKIIKKKRVVVKKGKAKTGETAGESAEDLLAKLKESGEGNSTSEMVVTRRIINADGTVEEKVERHSGKSLADFDLSGGGEIKLSKLEDSGEGNSTSEMVVTRRIINADGTVEEKVERHSGKTLADFDLAGAASGELKMSSLQESGEGNSTSEMVVTRRIIHEDGSVEEKVERHSGKTLADLDLKGIEGSDVKLSKVQEFEDGNSSAEMVVTRKIINADGTVEEKVERHSGKSLADLNLSGIEGAQLNLSKLQESGEGNSTSEMVITRRIINADGTVEEKVERHSGKTLADFDLSGIEGGEIKLTNLTTVSDEGLAESGGTVTITKTVKTIGGKVTTLSDSDEEDGETVTITKSVKTIGREAFGEEEKTKKVTVQSSEESESDTEVVKVSKVVSTESEIKQGKFDEKEIKSDETNGVVTKTTTTVIKKAAGSESSEESSDEETVLKKTTTVVSESSVIETCNEAAVMAEAKATDEAITKEIKETVTEEKTVKKISESESSDESDEELSSKKKTAVESETVKAVEKKKETKSSSESSESESSDEEKTAKPVETKETVLAVSAKTEAVSEEVKKSEEVKIKKVSLSPESSDEETTVKAVETKEEVSAKTETVLDKTDEVKTKKASVSPESSDDETVETKTVSTTSKTVLDKTDEVKTKKASVSPESSDDETVETKTVSTTSKTEISTSYTVEATSVESIEFSQSSTTESKSETKSGVISISAEEPGEVELKTTSGTVSTSFTDSTVVAEQTSKEEKSSESVEKSESVIESKTEKAEEKEVEKVVEKKKSPIASSSSSASSSSEASDDEDVKKSSEETKKGKIVRVNTAPSSSSEEDSDMESKPKTTDKIKEDVVEKVSSEKIETTEVSAAEIKKEEVVVEVSSKTEAKIIEDIAALDQQLEKLDEVSKTSEVEQKKDEEAKEKSTVVEESTSVVKEEATVVEQQESVVVSSSEVKEEITTAKEVVEAAIIETTEATTEGEPGAAPKKKKIVRKVIKKKTEPATATTDEPVIDTITEPVVSTDKTATKSETKESKEETGEEALIKLERVVHTERRLQPLPAFESSESENEEILTSKTVEEESASPNQEKSEPVVVEEIAVASQRKQEKDYKSEISAAVELLSKTSEETVQAAVITTSESAAEATVKTDKVEEVKETVETAKIDENKEIVKTELKDEEAKVAEKPEIKEEIKETVQESAKKEEIAVIETKQEITDISTSVVVKEEPEQPQPEPAEDAATKIVKTKKRIVKKKVAPAKEGVVVAVEETESKPVVSSEPEKKDGDVSVVVSDEKLETKTVSKVESVIESAVTEEKVETIKSEAKVDNIKVEQDVKVKTEETPKTEVKIESEVKLDKANESIKLDIQAVETSTNKASVSLLSEEKAASVQEWLSKSVTTSEETTLVEDKKRIILSSSSDEDDDAIWNKPKPEEKKVEVSKVDKEKPAEPLQLEEVKKESEIPKESPKDVKIEAPIQETKPAADKATVAAEEPAAELPKERISDQYTGDNPDIDEMVDKILKKYSDAIGGLMKDEPESRILEEDKTSAVEKIINKEQEIKEELKQESAESLKTESEITANISKTVESANLENISSETVEETSNRRTSKTETEDISNIIGYEIKSKQESEVVLGKPTRRVPEKKEESEEEDDFEAAELRRKINEYVSNDISHKLAKVKAGLELVDADYDEESERVEAMASYQRLGESRAERMADIRKTENQMMGKVVETQAGVVKKLGSLSADIGSFNDDLNKMMKELEYHKNRSEFGYTGAEDEGKGYHRRTTSRYSDKLDLDEDLHKDDEPLYKFPSFNRDKSSPYKSKYTDDADLYKTKSYTTLSDTYSKTEPYSYKPSYKVTESDYKTKKYYEDKTKDLDARLAALSTRFTPSTSSTFKRSASVVSDLPSYSSRRTPVAHDRVMEVSASPTRYRVSEVRASPSRRRPLEVSSSPSRHRTLEVSSSPSRRRNLEVSASPTRVRSSRTTTTWTNDDDDVTIRAVSPPRVHSTTTRIWDQETPRGRRGRSSSVVGARRRSVSHTDLPRMHIVVNPGTTTSNTVYQRTATRPAYDTDDDTEWRTRRSTVTTRKSTIEPAASDWKISSRVSSAGGGRSTFDDLSYAKPSADYWERTKNETRGYCYMCGEFESDNHSHSVKSYEAEHAVPLTTRVRARTERAKTVEPGEVRYSSPSVTVTRHHVPQDGSYDFDLRRTSSYRSPAAAIRLRNNHSSAGASTYQPRPKSTTYTDWETEDEQWNYKPMPKSTISSVRTGGDYSSSYKTSTVPYDRSWDSKITVEENGLRSSGYQRSTEPKSYDTYQSSSSRSEGRLGRESSSRYTTPAPTTSSSTSTSNSRFLQKVQRRSLAGERAKPSDSFQSRFLRK